MLYINTWGGTWEAAAKQHLFSAFTNATGVEIRTVSPISVAKLAAQARTGVYEFDVTTLGAGDILSRQLDQDHRADHRQDESRHGALEGRRVPEGVASHCFSTMIVYRKDKFPNGGPKNWAEFWDTQKFPGTRTMQRYAARIIPIALLADGVPMDKLYPLDGERAFSALERIKPHIRVWWTQGPQSRAASARRRGGPRRDLAQPGRAS